MTPTPTLATTVAADGGADGRLHIGFLTVLHEASGYLGGYLVTNIWGRPVEFRLSSAVQPNRVQEVLYAGTLQPYICADLIGRTLVEKTTTSAQLIVTDREPVLDLRARVAMPVAWLAPVDLPIEAQTVCVRETGRCLLICHPGFPQDASAVKEILRRLDPAFDLAEPFARVREAIGEARKLGVVGKQAG